MFRFTIRDLLWLTVVVALAIAWWLDHQRSSRDFRRMAEANAKLRYEAIVAKEEAVFLRVRLSRQSGRASGSNASAREDPFK
jgi:hypothetical protein